MYTTTRTLKPYGTLSGAPGNSLPESDALKSSSLLLTPEVTLRTHRLSVLPFARPIALPSSSWGCKHPVRPLRGTCF